MQIPDKFKAQEATIESSRKLANLIVLANSCFRKSYKGPLAPMTMLDVWINCQTRLPSTYKHFTVIDVREKLPPSLATKQHLSELLQAARFDPTFIAAASKELGWSRVAEKIKKSNPRLAKNKRGRLGEVLACALLEQIHGFQIPVQKHRFIITRDQSLPGTDAIAIRLNSDRDLAEVCFVESKLRTVADTAAALEGYEQLARDYDDALPDMLMFIAQRLCSEHHPLESAFFRYLRARPQNQDADTFKLFLVYENAKWSDAALQNLEDAEPRLSPMQIHVVMIAGLASLVDQAFELAGLETPEDDE